MRLNGNEEWPSTTSTRRSPHKAAVLDIERGKLDQMRPLFWQTDTSVSIKSWGYIEKDEFRSAGFAGG